jgi:hypothetical protein
MIAAAILIAFGKPWFFWTPPSLSSCWRSGGAVPLGAVSGALRVIAATKARARSATSFLTTSSTGSAHTSLTSALPTTTPSAIRATAAACSGVEIPKPTATGSFRRFRTARTSAASSRGSALRSPVTPVRET